MSVIIEPQIVLFPDVYISSSASLPLRAVNKENIKKTLFLSDENPKKKKKTEETVDIYDPRSRSNMSTSHEYKGTIFQFEEEKFELWPFGTKQILVTFMPKMAKLYETTVYLYTEDLSFVYPLKIKGKGLPPCASFLTDCIQVGHVGLGSIFDYEVEFCNKGSSEIDFELEETDHNGLIFEFNPSKGHLGIQECAKISIRFIAAHVCQFNESCVFKISGLTDNQPSITFIGKVEGPSFSITPTMLNFGDVGYGFLYKKVITIENRSNIPFDFNFLVKGGKNSKRREYQLSPDTGRVESFEKKDVIVEFIPSSIQQYDINIEFNIDNYKNAISVIHVSANCVSPLLELDTDVLDFGEIFIGCTYTKEIKIKNNTTFGASFDFKGSEKEKEKLGVLTAGKENGIVNPESYISLPINLVGNTLGNISLECSFVIYGATYPPLNLVANAICIGPKISYSLNTVSFGSIPILKEEKKNLVIENKSLIKACFRAQIEQQDEVFKADILEGEIEPNQSITVPISAIVRDVLTFEGKIRFSFNYLSIQSIPLTVTGVGTPIISSINMKKIDLGYLLTKQLSVTQFTLTNVSQRQYEVRLSHTKPHIPKDSTATVKVSVKPDFMILEPDDTATIEIHVSSDKIVSFNVQVNCDTTVKRTRTEVYSTLVEGSFIDPVVSFSTNVLEFNQDSIQKEISIDTISPTMEILKVQQKSLTLTNDCQLPLEVAVNCPQPFSIVSSNFTINPNESVTQYVMFDPSFKEDYNSELVSKKLGFSFNNHPQEMFVTLKALIAFPNIEFDTDKEIDFGVMMDNTESTKTISMKNTFNDKLYYKWEIIGKSEAFKIFDAFPIRGIIEPLDCIETHFSFYAKSGDNKTNKTYDCVAVCHVKGGPDYTFNLTGTSASIEYKIEPKEFNLKKVDLISSNTMSTFIENLSHVPMSFKIKIPKKTLFSVFTASPMSGTVPPKSVQEVKLNIVPGLPKNFREQWTVQIGKFEDSQMLICCDAEFSQVLVNLPRSYNDPATRSLYKKKENAMKEYVKRSSLILPAIAASDDEEEETISEIEFTEEELLNEEKEIVSNMFFKQKFTPSRNQRLFPEKSQTLADSQPISVYVLDLGTIIYGQELTKTFTITNKASFDISFNIETAVIKRTGFKVEPATFTNIPSGESVDVNVSFNVLTMKQAIEGDVEYNIPIRFPDMHSICIKLKAEMKSPKLSISQSSFDFENVIIGQTKIMTLQLQNVNQVNCQFEFTESQVFEITKKNTKQKPKDAEKQKGKEEETEESEELKVPIFTIVPSSGIIQPSSYANIALHFSPQSEKSYQIPLTMNIKHCKEPVNIACSGNGTKLMLTFTPSELEIPSVLPFSGSSFGTFVVSNPTKFPIDFLSLQFDQQLTEQEVSNVRDMESPFVTYTPKIRVPASTAKISACIIVDGPPLSGKTTLCNELSKEYGLPIISIDEMTALDSTEVTEKLVGLFSSDEYRNGFIIDGYNFTNDQIDEQFIQQCIKQKKDCLDDILVHKNSVFQVNNHSTYQQISDIVMRSLGGQYVFHISLNLTPDKVLERQEKMIKRKRREDRKAKRAEIMYLMSMTEEEYQALSPEEQEEVDMKRSALRKIPKEEEHDKKEKKPLATSRKGKESDKEKPKDQKGSERGKESKSNGKKAKPGVFSNPLELRTFAYLLSAGSINQKLSKTTDNFRVVDPSIITHFSNTTNNSVNSMTVDAKGKKEDILNTVQKFLPKLSALKEYISKEHIPAPSTVDNNTTADIIRLTSKTPKYFSLVEEGAQKTTPRWHLEPGEEITMKVFFDPKSAIGSFAETLLFAIEGSSSPPIQLKAISQCSNPAINLLPKYIFPLVTKQIDTKKGPSYIRENNELNFGYCLPMKEKPSKGGIKVSTKLKLQNTGLSPAELTFYLNSGGQKQTVWQLENTAKVMPGNDPQMFEISFCPTAVGKYQTPLTIFIKDNPDPYTFMLTGECCNPVLEISPQSVEFEKKIINQESTKKIELKNVGKVSTFWRLKNTNNLAGLVTFNAQEGCIPPKSSFNLFAKFISPKAAILKKPFSIEILDAEHSRVFETLTIPVTGEAFDVLFDVIIQKKDSIGDQLDYGLMKVGQTRPIPISLKNRGKYNVKYEITLDKRLQKYLQINPLVGVISPADKNVVLQTVFNGIGVIKYNIPSGIVITLTDVQTKTVTAVLKYTVIGQAAYSSYQISCQKKICFGTCSNTTPMQKEITLKNTGFFPIEYEFKQKEGGSELDPHKTQSNLPPIKTTNRGRKSQMAQSGGPFNIAPLSGTIQVNQVAKIIVSYDTQVPGMKTMNWSLCVPGASQQESTANIKITGSSYVPSISMVGTDKVFPKVPMCLRVDLNKKDINCFIEDEQTIHFAPKIVDQKSTIPFVIRNIQPVECNIDISVKSKTKGQCPFEIMDKISVVPPNKSINTFISFHPMGCDLFQAVIEITVKGLTPQVFRYPVEGIGTLPIVSLVTQLDKTKNGHVCNMGRTLLGTEKEKEIIFVNDGKISANVLFSFKPNPDFIVNGIEKDQVTCEPGNQIKLQVVHKPQHSRKGQLEFSLSIAENPKFSIPIMVSGEGFCEDIQFENLGDDNDLHFPDAVAGRSQQVTFSIKNVSENDLKFILNSGNEIQFIPKVGHLRMNQVKEITATFFSDKPVKMQPGKANLQITKIIFDNDDDYDWDDSKKMITYVKRSELQPPTTSKSHSKKEKVDTKAMNELVKINTVIPEPKFKVVSGTKPRDIPIKVFIISDQIKYTFDTPELSFAPTMMYQSRTSECKLTNTCGVRIEYNWSMKNFEALRGDYTKKFEPPFDIEPKAGFIDPGQAQVFNVMFAPLEVDDFKAKFACEILYTSLESPTINITALSRRPLCHFNIETSNYLSHRHPDYTYALPENVRVVEFFAKAPGTRSVKRIEMINPTADAYETVWSPTAHSGDNAIRCDSKISLISSGKHYCFQFTFTPKSPNLVESLWEFEIPKHNVKVPFLFVGRIKH